MSQKNETSRPKIPAAIDPKAPYDLRRVLQELSQLPGALHETHRLVDPDSQLAGVYRYIGAGGTVMRPTQEGPALIFNNVKGFPKTRVAIGLMASRQRVGAIWGTILKHWDIY